MGSERYDAMVNLIAGFHALYCEEMSKNPNIIYLGRKTNEILERYNAPLLDYSAVISDNGRSKYMEMDVYVVDSDEFIGFGVSVYKNGEWTTGQA